MLTPEEKAEREQIALQKCDDFLLVVNAIRDAGLEAGLGAEGRGTLLLFDTDGKLWPKQPWEMGVADIAEYIEMKFGPTFVRFLRSFEQFITH
jgi:hypothetical protein